MKNIKGALGIIIIFFVIPFGTLAILWKERCKTERLAEVPSEYGDFVAARSSVDCGDTMKVATEVVLETHPAAGKGESETILVLSGVVDLPMRWSPGPTLTIDLPVTAVVVKHKRAWKDVTIAFTGGPKAKG